jgi:tetratricopeptide (TPR) repeat protein
VAGNPRIEELRKKVEKDPGSRLFAQLAEELRKERELDDAIAVAREGLQKHPNYPSARMTLGRCLLDTGDFKAARSEFEQVLKGAPDNILASRFLAECLESLGDIPGAVARYKSTLLLAPGDKHVLARLEGLEKGAAATQASTSATLPPRPPITAPPVRPSAPPAPPPPEPEPPTVDLRPQPELPTVLIRPSEPTPIPLVAADEEFELERPYEAPTLRAAEPPAAPATGSPSAYGFESVRDEVPGRAAPDVPFTPPAPPIDEVEDQEFDPGLSTLPFTPPTKPVPTFRTDLLAQAALDEQRAAAEARVAAAADESSAALPSAGEAEGAAGQAVASATLAEIYFSQGLIDKAAAVYRELVQRDPANARAHARLAELEAVPAGAPAGEPPPVSDPVADRRRRVERTIARLEGFLAAVKRG